MQDKPVALVTGSSTGIGKYVAMHLLATDYAVVGCSRTTADWSHQKYLHLQADVSDEDNVKSVTRHIRDTFGRLDVVVNNAGIASMNHVLLTPVSTVDRIMQVNLRGTFLVSRECARLMQRRKFGRIVNLTTVAVPLQLEGEAVYASSKSAVETLTRVMGRELAPFGITVNAIGPSPINTNLIRGVPAATIDAVVARLAIKRLCTPEDIVNVVEFFIRPESGYITGQVIYLGGVS